MCRIFEEYGEEVRAEARAERNIEIAEKLLRKNKLTLEEISDTADVPIEKVEQLAQKLAATAMA